MRSPSTSTPGTSVTNRIRSASETHRERGRGLVRVDVERSELGVHGERRDDREKTGIERPEHGERHGRQRIADQPETRHGFRAQPDLVADQADGVRTDGSAHLCVDGDERLADDLQHSRRCDSTPTDELDRDAASLELSRDLRSRTVNDDDFLTRPAQSQRVGSRIGRDTPTEFQDDTSHVVYSALMRT